MVDIFSLLIVLWKENGEEKDTRDNFHWNYTTQWQMKFAVISLYFLMRILHCNQTNDDG